MLKVREEPATEDEPAIQSSVGNDHNQQRRHEAPFNMNELAKELAPLVVREMRSTDDDQKGNGKSFHSLRKANKHRDERHEENEKERLAFLASKVVS